MAIFFTLKKIILRISFVFFPNLLSCRLEKFFLQIKSDKNKRLKRKSWPLWFLWGEKEDSRYEILLQGVSHKTVFFLTEIIFCDKGLGAHTGNLTLFRARFGFELLLFIWFFLSLSYWANPWSMRKKIWLSSLRFWHFFTRSFSFVW